MRRTLGGGLTGVLDRVEADHYRPKFLTDQPIGKIAKGQESFSFSVPTADAIMVKLVPSNQ